MLSTSAKQCTYIIVSWTVGLHLHTYDLSKCHNMSSNQMSCQQTTAEIFIGIWNGKGGGYRQNVWVCIKHTRRPHLHWKTWVRDNQRKTPPPHWVGGYLVDYPLTHFYTPLGEGGCVNISLKNGDVDLKIDAQQKKQKGNLCRPIIINYYYRNTLTIGK